MMKEIMVEAQAAREAIEALIGKEVAAVTAEALAAVAEALVAQEEEVQEEILMDLERCIKQYVLIAARNAKCLSSQQKAEKFSAKNAIERRKDSDSNS